MALVVDYSWKVQALSSEAILVIYLVKVADFWWANYLFSAVQYWRLFPKLVKRNVNVQVLLRLLQISSYSLHSFETNFNWVVDRKTGFVKYCRANKPPPSTKIRLEKKFDFNFPAYLFSFLSKILPISCSSHFPRESGLFWRDFKST